MNTLDPPLISDNFTVQVVEAYIEFIDQKWLTLLQSFPVVITTSLQN